MCKYLYKATLEQPELSNCIHIYYMYVFSMIFKEIKGYIKQLMWFTVLFTVNCNEEIVGGGILFFESRYGNILAPFRKPGLAERGSEVAERWNIFLYALKLQTGTERVMEG